MLMSGKSRRYAPRSGKSGYVRCKDGRWYYQRAVPDRWRVIVGKSTWSEALGQITEAQARRIGRDRAAEHDAYLNALAELGEQGARNLRVEQLTQMAVTAKAQNPGAADLIDLHLGIELRKIGWRPTAAQVARWSANALRAELAAPSIGSAGLNRDDPDDDPRDCAPSFDPEAREEAEIKIERLEREAERLEASAEGRTVWTALSAWRALKRQRDETWRKYEQQVREFRDFLGKDLPLAQVTRAHADGFIQHLSTTPSENGQARSPGTVAKYRDCLTAYFRWASRRPGWGVKNIFADVDLPKDTRPKQAQSYDSFTDAQSAEFRRVARHRWSNLSRRAKPGRGRDYMLVLDLIMALGLRPQEACQLHVQNVKVGYGGLYLDVTTILDDEDAEWAKVARLKTGHSTRKVPIPRGLESAVYEQWDVAKVTGSGGLLFPSFAGVKNYSKAIGNDVSEHIKPKCSFRDNRRLVLYSARHRFRDLCEDCAVPEPIRLALMGHDDDNPTAGHYGDRDKWAAAKQEAIEKVFPLAFRDPAATEQAEDQEAAVA